MRSIFEVQAEKLARILKAGELIKPEDPEAREGVRKLAGFYQCCPGDCAAAGVK